MMSTGVYLRYTTNAHTVRINFTLMPICAENWFAGCHLWHMPDSGTSAFDMVVYDDDDSAPGWRHWPNGLEHYAESGSQTINVPDKLYSNVQRPVTYLLYLPLRNAPATISLTPYVQTGTDSVLCGGDGVAKCAPGVDTAPQMANPPIVWYGTSIQQGGVASRAGTAYDAVIARTLSREVLNLGFANNGIVLYFPTEMYTRGCHWFPRLLA